MPPQGEPAREPQRHDAQVPAAQHVKKNAERLIDIATRDNARGPAQKGAEPAMPPQGEPAREPQRQDAQEPAAQHDEEEMPAACRWETCLYQSRIGDGCRNGDGPKHKRTPNVKR